MFNWVVESGQMKVIVVSDTPRNAMLKAVFNFNGYLSVFISARKEDETEENALWWITEEIIKEIKNITSSRMKIGVDIITEIRNSLNLDKTTFALKCHLHRQYYFRLERGEQFLTEKILNKILFHCGITDEQFFNRLEEKYNQLLK